jgi:hypothetical protein
MSRMLFIMPHIALCTPCIALVNGDHLLYMWVDHVEPESKFQAEQVQWAFGGPQASSYEDANIVVIKASLSIFNQCSLSFNLNLSLCFTLFVH